MDHFAISAGLYGVLLIILKYDLGLAALPVQVPAIVPSTPFLRKVKQVLSHFSTICSYHSETHFSIEKSLSLTSFLLLQVDIF